MDKMIWTLLPFGLVVVFVAAIFLASSALADRPVCSSEEKLPGEDPIAHCLAEGERFAKVDKHDAI